MQQFKIGDWVDYAGEFYRVHEEYNGKGNISKEVVNSLVRHGKNVQLWQPKEGEWCWFYDDTEGTPIFGRFYKQDKDFGNCCYPQHQINSPYSYCEPFIGKLPTFLQH